MSVFTPLTSSQIQRLLNIIELRVVHFSAASEGIENSNFFVSAEDRYGRLHELVLTIVESLSLVESQWSQQLLRQLAIEGLAVPAPLTPLQRFEGKPVALAAKLTGGHPQRPNTAQVRSIGEFLARLHRSQFSTPSPMANERQRLQALSHYCHLLPQRYQHSANKLLNQWQHTTGHRCLIHGDLFRDNALFEGDRLSAVLDFYHSSFDLPVYDVAVALNDWAVDENATEQPQLTAALLQSYQLITPLADPHLLPLACAVAALRFWLSRIAAQQQAVTAHAGRGSKPADEFAAKFAYRLSQLEGGD